MVPNTYKVPKSQWKKWGRLAQTVFNEVNGIMLVNKDMYHHPKATPAIDKHWSTTAWNAAWTAADSVQEEIRHI